MAAQLTRERRAALSKRLEPIGNTVGAARQGGACDNLHGTKSSFAGLGWEPSKGITMRSMAPGALALVLMASTGLVAAPLTARAQIGIGIGIRVNLAPPPLPIYEQPPIPDPDYLWAPGYWAWDQNVSDYYWVPGTWVQPPQPGYLWTPSYWGWDNGVYIFHDGYWGQHIGFYGGVDYGFGYTGSGYQGGYWQGNHFFYNRSVNNITNVHITNVFNKTVVNRGGGVRASYNGGPGGVSARPTPAEASAEHERHLGPTPNQAQHVKLASSNKSLFASANHGHPAIAATQKPAAFTGAGVTHAAGKTPAYTLTAAHAGAGAHPTAGHAGSTPAAAGDHGPRGETTAHRGTTHAATPAERSATPRETTPKPAPHTVAAPRDTLAPDRSPTPRATTPRPQVEHTERAPAARPEPAVHAVPTERAAPPRPAPAQRAAPAPRPQAAPHEEHKEPK